MATASPLPTYKGPAYKKVSLIKNRVGVVRAPSFPLPGFDHVYGALIEKDPDTTGTVLSDWKEGEHSAEAVLQRSWIRTNALAIKHGNITAKSQREFSKTHPNIKVTKAQATIRERFKAPTDRIYGKTSVKSDIRFRDIVEGRFNPSMNEEDRDYPEIGHRAHHGRCPKPRPTRSSELLQQTRAGSPEAASTKLFIMKKFMNVPSKIFAA